MTFYVGQKVVCVYSFPHEGHPDDVDGYPIRGNIYTVRGTITWPEPIGLGLYLFEIVRRPLLTEAGYCHERTFAAAAFRPVEERKTDISIFTEILDGINKRETVRT